MLTIHKPSPITKINITIRRLSKNYQATQNTQNLSITQQLPQNATFKIPIQNEPYANFSEPDQYEE